mgnify:CR=1 FL=1
MGTFDKIASLSENPMGIYKERLMEAIAEIMADVPEPDAENTSVGSTIVVNSAAHAVADMLISQIERMYENRGQPAPLGHFDYAAVMALDLFRKALGIYMGQALRSKGYS